MLEINKGDHVKLRILGHHWIVEYVGKYHIGLYYRGKRLIVDMCKIKHKKVRGKYRRIRR